jgi:chemotaxis protein CheD
MVTMNPSRSEARPSRRSAHFLHPGAVFASAEPHQVTTLLGTCVAVCLWDPRSAIGGLNHFLMPLWAGSGELSARFGNQAMAALLDQMLALGAFRDSLRAKVFGGMRRKAERFPDTRDLGLENTRLAFRLLEEEGIPVAAQDTGGGLARKLIYFTDTGDAFVKQLSGEAHGHRP